MLAGTLDVNSLVSLAYRPAGRPLVVLVLPQNLCVLRRIGARERVPSWAWLGYQSFSEWSQPTESSFLIRTSGTGKTKLAAKRGQLIMAGEGPPCGTGFSLSLRSSEGQTTAGSLSCVFLLASQGTITKYQKLGDLQHPEFIPHTSPNLN